MQHSLDISALLQSLQNSLASFAFIRSELMTGLFFLLLMFIGLFKSYRKYLNKTAILLALVLVWLNIEDLYTVSSNIFSGVLAVQGQSAFLKLLFALSALATLIFSDKYFAEKQLEETGYEFTYLIFSSLLGLSFMLLANEFLTLFIGMEIVSLGAYSMAGFLFNKKSAESAMKYFLFGAFSSALMLYGISLLYGLSGTLNFAEPIFWTKLSQTHELLPAIGLCLFAAGLLFKISAFPFHIWTPDVYEGSPVPMVAFSSVTQKAAAIWVLSKFTIALSATPFATYSFALLAIIAIITITIGNFGALTQFNYKRLLAYSSIAQAGFIMIGLISVKDSGVQAILFYIAVYILMNLGTFFLLDLLSSYSGSEDIRSYAGIGRTNPFLGILAIIMTISLTGLPPTLGFSAKLLIFSSLWDFYQSNGQNLYLILFVFALINTVISLFFYIRIPYFMFFKTSNKTVDVQVNRKHKILVSFLALPLIILFIKFDWLLSIIGHLN